MYVDAGAVAVVCHVLANAGQVDKGAAAAQCTEYARANVMQAERAVAAVLYADMRAEPGKKFYSRAHFNCLKLS